MMSCRVLATLRSLRERRGQALAEFALLLPILIAVFVGMIEFGQAWHSYQVVTHAGREAGRLAATPSSSEAEVLAAVNDMLTQASLDPARAEIELHLHSHPGSADTVIIRYPHEFFMLAPVVGLMQREGEGDEVPGSILLQARFVMRNE